MTDITSAAEVVSGSIFLASTRVVRSRSVTTPITRCSASQMGRKPIPASAITEAALRTLSCSVNHSTFLFMMSEHFIGHLQRYQDDGHDSARHNWRQAGMCR